MAGVPGYANALAALKPGGAAGGAGAPPPMPQIGSATGAPKPSMIGAVPTGAGAVPNKVAIGTAIQALREVKAQYPDSASDIDKQISMLQSLANPAAPSPASASPAPDAEGGDAPM